MSYQDTATQFQGGGYAKYVRVLSACDVVFVLFVYHERLEGFSKNSSSFALRVALF